VTTQPNEQMRQQLERAYTGLDTTPEQQHMRDQERIVREHAGLVRRVARRFARASGGAVDVEDLTSVGMMGLLDAHGKYDPAGGRSFEVYAEFRVRGAIIDEMRRMDPMTQPMRRKARALARARDAAAQELGCQPTEEELAAHMHMELDALQSMRRDVQPQIFVSDDGVVDICDDLVMSALDRVSMHSMVSKSIESLPERLQQVLALYYFEDLTLREIGLVLELTEARVCQLHKEAVVKMQKYLHSEGILNR